MTKKIYLISDYNKDFLIEKLFDENNGYFDETEIMSIDNFVSQHMKNKPLNIFDVRKIIINNNFKLLNCNDIDFLKEALKFKDFLDKNNFYDYDLLKFESEDLIYQELKRLLKLMPCKDYKDLYSFIKENTFENYVIYEDFFDFFDKKIVKMLIEKNAKYISYQKNNKELKRFESLNKRCEIETFLQNVLKDEEGKQRYQPDEVAFVCLNDDYLNILKACLDRYNYEYYINFKNYTPNIFYQFVALFEFYLKNDDQYYLYLLNQNIETKNDFSAFKYFKKTKQKIKKDDFSYYKNFNKKYQSFTEEEIDDGLKYYKTLESDLNQIHLNYKKIIEFINKEKNKTEDLINFFFDVLVKNNDDQEIKYLKNYLEENFEIIKEIDVKKDLKLFEIFKKYTYSKKYKKIRKNNQIIITKLENPIINNNIKVLYILGANQKNFMNFKTFKGYFDEECLKGLGDKVCDSLLRQKDYKENCKWLLNFENVFFSHPTTTFSGKKDELSYQLEEFLSKEGFVDVFVDFKLIQNNNTKNVKKEKISKENAQKLFFDEDMYFITSVSSLERYIACPYYFLLEKGFGLTEEKKLELNAALSGTITHKIFEKMLSKDKEVEYQKVDDNLFLKTIVEEYFDFVSFLNSNEYNKLNLLKNDFTKKINYACTSFKQKDNFKPFDFEKRILEKIEFKDVKYLIRGFIDRIDILKQNHKLYFDIIDYKTSKHTITKKQIEEGKKLQLIIYALICKECGDKIFKQNDYEILCSSINYYNVIKEVENFIFYNYKIKTGIELNKLDDKETKSLIKTLSFEEKKDFEEIKESVFVILRSIYENVKNGNFPLQPLENVKIYEDYKRIAHYKGKGIKERNFDYE